MGPVLRNDLLLEANPSLQLLNLGLHLSLNRGHIVAQQLLHLPNGEAVAFQPHTFQNLVGLVEGIVAVAVLPGLGVDDPQLLVIFQKVGGNTHLLRVFSNAVGDHIL